jgi:hypothetical protein
MVDLGLSQVGKEELALALLLWKDFKTQNNLDPEITLQMFKLSETLGVTKELTDLIPKIPPLKWTQKY